MKITSQETREAGSIAALKGISAEEDGLGLLSIGLRARSWVTTLQVAIVMSRTSVGKKMGAVFIHWKKKAVPL